MSLSGARGLSRIATNPACELQAAMVSERYHETKLFRAITGRDYPKEYGERTSARRRGAKFEANLFQNDAALLRKATGPLYGHDPAKMWVRNLLDELPGTKADRLALRASRFSRIMRDLAGGRYVPDLVIQPTLVLPVGPDWADVIFICPDYVVLDRKLMIYVPGELKSFIVRDIGPNPEDLAPTRLQAAVEVIALRSEAERVGIADRVKPRAVFVFAKPYGLMPTPASEERLYAEVAMIARAIDELRRTKQRLTQLRAPDGAELPDLVEALHSNFQESCIATCALADICRSRHTGRTPEIGDAVVDLFGPDFDIERLAALAMGAAPRTPLEVAIAGALRRAAQALDLGDPVSLQRTA